MGYTMQRTWSPVFSVVPLPLPYNRASLQPETCYSHKGLLSTIDFLCHPGSEKGTDCLYQMETATYFNIKTVFPDMEIPIIKIGSHVTVLSL